NGVLQMPFRIAMPLYPLVRELARFFLEITSTNDVASKALDLQDFKKIYAQLAKRVGSEELQRLIDKAELEIKQERNSIVQGFQTRRLILEVNNSLFDFLRWSACWSRRDLEGLLGFFTEDAFYLDLPRNYDALGRSELRRLFSRLFHALNGATVITSAK